MNQDLFFSLFYLLFLYKKHYLMPNFFLINVMMCNYDIKKINIFIQKYTFIVFYKIGLRHCMWTKLEHMITEFTVKFCFKGRHL